MERVRVLDDGCWEWTGAHHPKGYAVVRVDGRTQRVSRILWRLLNGEIPPGHYVCHYCDKSSCVNPQHFFLGTAKANTDDMMAKGRNGYTARSGEKHVQAKMTDDQVAELRRRVAAGETQTALARELGVTQQAVSYALRRRKTTDEWTVRAH